MPNSAAAANFTCFRYSGTGENMAARCLASAVARTLLALFLAAAAATPVVAQNVSVQADVERTEVYVGEPFRFWIAVSGSDQVTAPDLEQIAGFSVRALGAGPNNSEIVTTINGRTARQVNRGYVLNYELTAAASGELTIPALTLQVEGQPQATRAIRIRARAPQQLEDYRLQLALDREQVWVGEPAVLTTTWLWNAELGPERMHGFSHPVLDNAAKRGLSYEHRAPTASGHDPVRLPVAGQEVLWQRGQTRIDGERFASLSFATMLLPEHPGQLHIGSATVVFEGVAGYRSVRDYFGRTARQPVRQRFVVPSNELRLTVKALPEQGRPAEFSGLVGRFEIAARATPLEVKVGDPMELSVTITGSGDLRRLLAPDLTRTSSLGEFRVSADSPPTLAAEQATIRHTLRALHHAVAEIPAVRISVFDADSGRYVELASEPIPITVHPTREVTLLDVEGAAANGTPSGPVASRREGIAHNYAGPMLLVDQRFDPRAWVASPGGLLALFAAPLLLAGLHVALALRRFRQRPRRPGAALANLRRAVAAAGSDAAAPVLLAALRTYLTDSLRTGQALHGFADVAGTLRERGVGEPALEELRLLFAALEAARYGGADTEGGNLAERLLAWAARMERSPRR